MTPDQLKKILVELLTDPGNEIGGNILGTYTLPGGSVIPAASDQRVPDDWKVHGVEMILPIAASGGTSWRVRHVVKDEMWQLELVQWPPVEGKPQYLREVVDRLERFLISSNTVTVAADDLLGTLPQARISFPNWEMKETVRTALFSP